MESCQPEGHVGCYLGVKTYCSVLRILGALVVVLVVRIMLGKWDRVWVRRLSKEKF